MAKEWLPTKQMVQRMAGLGQTHVLFNSIFWSKGHIRWADTLVAVLVFTCLYSCFAMSVFGIYLIGRGILSLLITENKERLFSDQYMQEYGRVLSVRVH